MGSISAHFAWGGLMKGSDGVMSICQSQWRSSARQETGRARLFGRDKRLDPSRSKRGMAHFCVTERKRERQREKEKERECCKQKKKKKDKRGHLRARQPQWRAEIKKRGHMTE